MLKEFRDFIMRGNILDLAVGIIIGTAFGAIVKSLVDDIIMPPIGMVIGGIDFSKIQIVLKAAEGDKAPVAINIGVFINALITFLIIAFVVFLLLRSVNRMMALTSKPAPAAAPTTKECPYCKSSIHLQATRCPNCTSQLT